VKVTIQTEAEKQAEIAMVGYAIQRPDRMDDFGLESWHFADDRLARAWETIVALRNEGKPIDPVTVADRIAGERSAELKTQGDASLVAHLTSADLQAAVFPEAYADIVRESWATRQVLFACSEVMGERQRGLEGADLLSFALEKLAAIHVEQEERAHGINDLVKARFRQLSALAEAKARGEVGVTGIPTGIAALDTLLGGLQRGICTVVAARPGMGKSAFGMTVTANASRLGLGVHVFSMEDPRESYVDRALSRESLVPAEKLRTCELQAGHLGQIAQAANALSQAGCWLVDDRGGITAEELVRSVRRSLKANKTQLVVVDYVQLLKGPPRVERTEALTHVMDVLANAALQDRIAYLVLAQLNRECEKRDNKRPILSDLKQSGAIEERSKCVLMLYRPAVYREKDKQGNPYPEERLEIIVRKNNQGQTGRAIADWHGPTTRVS